MPAPVRVVLNEEADRTLSELRLTTTVPRRTRDRAHMLRLNAQGRSAKLSRAAAGMHPQLLKSSSVVSILSERPSVDGKS